MPAIDSSKSRSVYGHEQYGLSLALDADQRDGRNDRRHTARNAGHNRGKFAEIQMRHLNRRLT